MELNEVKEIKAIPTKYNGVLFRSGTEASVAVFLDYYHIRRAYEREGFTLSDGQRYLPDFYLPDQDAFVEAKGILDDNSLKKPKLLAKNTKKTVFVISSDWEIIQIGQRLNGDNFDADYYISNRQYGEPGIYRCTKCGKIMIFDKSGLWKCPCCKERGEIFVRLPQREAIQIACDKTRWKPPIVEE